MAKTKTKKDPEEKPEKPWQFQPGNRFWEARTTHGRKKKFDSETLWAGCVEYFEWTHDNPLMEDKAYAFQGKITHDSVCKMRAMTIGGLCMFLDITQDTWRDYRSQDDFIAVITRAEDAIYTQKFTGASADLLNANIIARDLGLADKQEIKEHSTVSAEPQSVEEWEKEFGDGE